MSFVIESSGSRKQSFGYEVGADQILSRAPKYLDHVRDSAHVHQEPMSRKRFMALRRSWRQSWLENLQMSLDVNPGDVSNVRSINSSLDGPDSLTSSRTDAMRRFFALNTASIFPSDVQAHQLMAV